jgi:hypothetical protein
MQQHRYRVAVAVALAGLAVAAIWARAMSTGDDRSEIIVRSGSLIFENGTAADPGTPWAPRDTFLHEFKPEEPATGDKFKGVKNFEVTFVNPYGPLSAACAGTLTGKLVQVEYTKADGTTVQMKVRLRNFAGVGKSEPKVDPQGNDGLQAIPNTSPPQLALADNGGYISRISVDRIDCSFSPAPDLTRQQAFFVKIQPKAEP